MAFNSAIEWTDATLNMIRARNLKTGGVGHFCEKVSPGCSRCYAERMQPRFKNAIRYNEADRKLVEVFLDEKVLTQPMRWKRGRKIFVGSMTDLFGDWVTDEMLSEVFAAMALTPQHTYQVLTKRPDRMLQYFRGKMAEWRDLGVSETAENMYLNSQTVCDLIHVDGDLRSHLKEAGWFYDWNDGSSNLIYDGQIPLPNVWLGTSVEDRDTYIHRVPYLAMTPGAIKFLSIEPLLGDIGDLMLDGIFEGVYQWVIVGGESGPNARPFNIAWARSIIRQCKDAGVPVFTKQLGAKPYDSDLRIATPRSVIVPIDSDWTFTNKLVDRKGGDWSEWPDDVRIRELPNV